MDNLLKDNKVLNNDEQKDLDSFLKRVEDLESIVKDFKCDDLLKQETAMAKADEMLKQEDKMKFDKTVINKDAYKNNTQATTNAPHTTDQNAFLSAMETDARQRANARKKRHMQANLVKDEANICFQGGKYEEAVQLYTEAIEIARDVLALHTNRAMAYIKLEEYQKCIEDCNFALRIDPNCLKAFVRKGKAYQALKQYDDAIVTFNEILTVYPDKEKLVKDYIHQVNEQQRIENLESMAKVSLESHSPEAESISKLIERISCREDPIHEPVNVRMLYYAGGIRLLYTQLIDDKSRTLFRTEGGFDFLNKKQYLCKCVLSRKSMCKEEGEFASSVLIMLRYACSGCIENVEAMIKDDNIVQIVMNMFHANYADVITDNINLFLEFAKDEKIQNLVLSRFIPEKLARGLMGEEVFRFHLLDEAISCLMLYASNTKFQSGILSSYKDIILNKCTKYLSEINKSPRKIVPKYVKLLNTFAESKSISSLMCNDEEFWEACLHCLNHATHIMEPNSYREELMLNTLELSKLLVGVKGDVAIKFAPKLASIILPLIRQKDNTILLKALACLSRTMERSKECVKGFHSTGGLVFIKKLYKMISGDNVTQRTHSLKILCICGQVDASLLRNIPKIDKRYSSFFMLFNLDDNEVDKMNQGHAALLLGILSQLQGGTDPLVEDMDETSKLIQQMLVLCRDSLCKSTRYNCVIALGKMARTDSRILAELRRFDGINILARNKPPESWM